MYGLVNKAIQDLITTRFGQEVWAEVALRSYFEGQNIIGLQAYPDHLSYDFVKHASEITSVPPEEILFAVGEYWIKFTAEEGYGNILTLAGDTFPDFLKNLDMLHRRISNIMPMLQAPIFDTQNETENSIELLYRSNRKGLSPMLKGIIVGLGNRFEKNCTITTVKEKEEEGQPYIYKIEWR